MTENMKKFLEKVSADSDLAGRIGNMSKDEIVRTAQDLGCALADEDFEQLQQSATIADDELANVTGGVVSNCIMQGSDMQGFDTRCTCVMLGAGLTDTPWDKR